MEPDVPKAPDGLPKYDPLAVTLEGYLRTVRQEAQSVIDEHPLLKRGARSYAVSFANTIAANDYTDEVERCYESAGYRRCKKGEKRNLAQHLEWAVKTRVLSHKQADIALLSALAAPSHVKQSPKPSSHY